MSEGTYTPRLGDCVLAYCDSHNLMRAICWIVREDEPGRYLALFGETVRSEFTFRLVTATDVRRAELYNADGSPFISDEVRTCMSAAIRALAPLIP